MQGLSIVELESIFEDSLTIDYLKRLGSKILNLLQGFCDVVLHGLLASNFKLVISTSTELILSHVKHV